MGKTHLILCQHCCKLRIQVLPLLTLKMEIVAQLVRAPDCGSGGRGFETHLSPK